MKVVVIGGTGLIGSKVVDMLNQHGHEAIAAAPSTGVNTLTGQGLTEVLTGAQVVVDVANSPSFEDGPAWDFFTTATGNVLTTAESAGVSHIVALSVVGTDRLLASGYSRAKNAQEKLVSEAAIPFSIVRATQFFEFVGRIADSATDGDTRRVITDAQARYFGVVLDDHTLVPDTTATVLPTRFQDWLVDNAPAPVR
jgi:uncharacterized protein YbjT (DUF2867 family)